MMNFLQRYATDKTAEEDGQWVDFGDGLEVKLRRLNSVKSREVRRKLEKPYAKQFRNQDMPDSISEMILNNQLAKAIVVEWKGVPDPDDMTKELPCTEENILHMMQSFPDFREDILAAAMERATFQKEELVAAEKNSKSS